MNRFRELMTAGNEFILSYELVPGRVSKGKAIDSIFRFAEQAAKSGLIDALSLTDNPGGGPALSPDVLGKEIKETGIDPIIHFSGKDGNRNSVESRALALNRIGIENLLVMTGDFPADGHMGLAKPVFDLDSVNLLDYLYHMNEGSQHEIIHGEFSPHEKTNFFLGCVVSPFKTTEPEVMTQYYKLEKKIRSGAEYVITQLGYDTRKYHELLRYLRSRCIEIPVIGSIFVIKKGPARQMNRGNIPGCTVTDSFLSQLEKEHLTPDKGKSASLERAARQLAILKGLGYNGAHIEGFGLSFDNVQTIIESSREIGDNWREYADHYRYSPTGTYFHFDTEKEPPNCDQDISPMRPFFRFTAMWKLHLLIFEVGTVGYKMMKRLSTWIDGHVRALWLLYELERRSKAFLFGCRDCGDCVLPEMYFLCPESQCPKFQRIGPCGGSRDGMCEVFDDRFCVWYPVYIRARCTGTLTSLRDFIVPPRDWTLYGTSSWLNFFLGRDHAGATMREKHLDSCDDYKGLKQD
ncbi:methylenetetrahydrofolate reductase C-terminal domain-containing protein [Candidatus Latescibacterota bacterium]